MPAKSKCATLLTGPSAQKQPWDKTCIYPASRSLFPLWRSLLASRRSTPPTGRPAPVTVIVPFGAGGNTDMMARLGAQYLSDKLGQAFVVENRPGAGGALGTGQVAAAAPDGYTLLFSAGANITLTPQVQKLHFDPLKQLVPIVNVGTGTQMIAIRRDLPVKTLPEFIAYAKANPGKLNFTVAGTQNISHLAPVLLFARAGIDLVMVPDKAEPQAVSDLIVGAGRSLLRQRVVAVAAHQQRQDQAHRGQHRQTDSGRARHPDGGRDGAWF